MATIKLDADEHIVEDGVKMYGPVPHFALTVIVPVLTALVIGVVCRYAIPAFYRMATNPVTSQIKAYRVLNKLYLPIMGLLVLAMVYYIISLYAEKIVLTNKAVLRRNVFSVERIYFKDITSVSHEGERFNTTISSRQQSYILGLLLGINRLIDIEARDNRRMLLKNMSRRYAAELAAKLEAARAVGIAGSI